MSGCPCCQNDTLEERLVETWMRREGRWVLLKNVPAMVCEPCGEKLFSQEVAERLARIVRADSAETPTGLLGTPVFDLAVIDGACARGERPVSISGTAQPPAEATGQQSLLPPAEEMTRRSSIVDLP